MKLKLIGYISLCILFVQRPLSITNETSFFKVALKRLHFEEQLLRTCLMAGNQRVFGEFPTYGFHRIRKVVSYILNLAEIITCPLY